MVEQFLPRGLQEGELAPLEEVIKDAALFFGNLGRQGGIHPPIRVIKFDSTAEVNTILPRFDRNQSASGQVDGTSNVGAPIAA